MDAEFWYCDEDLLVSLSDLSDRGILSTYRYLETDYLLSDNADSHRLGLLAALTGGMF